MSFDQSPIPVLSMQAAIHAFVEKTERWLMQERSEELEEEAEYKATKGEKVSYHFCYYQRQTSAVATHRDRSLSIDRDQLISVEEETVFRGADSWLP